MKATCPVNPDAERKWAKSSSYISIHLFSKLSNTSASNNGGKTFYSLLVTFYSLLVTFYSLLVIFTRQSLLFARYSLLFTCYSLLFTCYSLNFTRYSLHCTRYLLLVTFYSSFFTQYSLVLTCYSLLLTGYLLHFILTALPYIHNVHIILCVSCGKRKYKPWMLFLGRSILSDMM